MVAGGNSTPSKLKFTILTGFRSLFALHNFLFFSLSDTYFYFFGYKPVTGSVSDRVLKVSYVFVWSQVMKLMIVVVNDYF